MFAAAPAEQQLLVNTAGVLGFTSGAVSSGGSDNQQQELKTPLGCSSGRHQEEDTEATRSG